MADALICQYEGCTNELTYSGRGRPPKYCEEHKAVAKASPAAPAARPRPGAEKAADAPAARPRPGAAVADPTPRARPGAANGSPAKETPAVRSRPGEVVPPAVGKADQKSRAKAEGAANRNQALVDELSAVPMGVGGRPMAKIRMTASELVPTGQYANVSVGPALVECYVDLDRDTNGGGYFTDAEKTVMVTALNELAEVVERDVIAVQRSLVLESMQEQLAAS